MEDLDKAIDKGLFEVKLRLKDTGSETFNAICTYYVGTAYWFDKNFKKLKFVVTLPTEVRTPVLFQREKLKIQLNIFPTYLPTPKILSRLRANKHIFNLGLNWFGSLYCQTPASQKVSYNCMSYMNLMILLQDNKVHWES